MLANPEGELDPAVDDRKCCQKNFSSVLSYIDKRTKEACDRGSKVGTVYSASSSVETERIVRKISSPGSVAGVPYLCNDRG